MAGKQTLPDAGAFAEVINRMQNERPDDSDFQMTKEEGQKLLEAFKKPEFRQMFQEYVEEISDPKNRAEYEAHLKQMEADNMVPQDKELLRPQAGFCIKTKTQDDQKIFINVCHHEKIDPPVMTPSGTGQEWKVPNSLGPPRMEKDNSGKPCVTFDIAFHTQALATAARSKPFKNMICDVSIEQVQSKYRQYQRSDTTLNKDYRILRKVACIGGTPAVMTLARPKKAKASSEATKPKDATAKPASKPASKPAAQSTTKSNKTRRAASKAGAKKQASHAATATPPAAAASTPPLPPGCEVPVYKIVHRGELDLGDFGLSRTDSTLKRPKELVVKIDLPRLKSIKKVELDVSERELTLVAPGKYQLAARLPYPVNDGAAAARFVKDKRRLVVTLPVKRPPKPAAKPFVEPVAADDDDNDEPSEAAPPTQVPKRAVDHSRWVGSAANSDSAPPAAADAPPSEPSKAVQRPPHVYRESATSVTVLLNVARADAASLNVDATSTYLRISFSAAQPSGDAVPYEFVLSPLRPVQASSVRVDVASDNLVVLLKKESAGMWGTLGVVAEPGAGTARTDPAPAPAPTPAPAAPAVVDDALDAAFDANAEFVPSARFCGARPGFVFTTRSQGVGYYRDSGAPGAAKAGAAAGAGAGAGATKAVPAPRRSARVVTHSTGKAQAPTRAGQGGKRPHPLTGAPEVGEAGAAVVAAAASSATPAKADRKDLSSVNLQNSAIFEID